MPNCKVGDNCIIRITKDLSPEHKYEMQPFEGKIVKIVEDLSLTVPQVPPTVFWVVSPKLLGRNGEHHDYFHDKVLFPLLNASGEDEVLQKVGKPPQLKKVDNALFN